MSPNRCLLCQGTSFTEQAYFSGTTDRYKDLQFIYARCQGCGSIKNTTTENIDYTDYPTGKSISSHKVQCFLKLLQQQHITTSHKILDYGCGNGALLSALCKKGYDIDGYEPHHPPFGQLEPGKTFDLIYLTHVFEHLPNYEEFFAHLQLLTKPGSRIITIHPSSSRMPKLNPKSPFQAFTIHAPYHLTIPSDQATVNMFTHHGYELQKLYTYDVQRSGWKDNSRVSALLAQALGTKEEWLAASKKKKILAVLRSPFSFFDALFLRTKDKLVSTFVFERTK